MVVGEVHSEESRTVNMAAILVKTAFVGTDMDSEVQAFQCGSEDVFRSSPEEHSTSQRGPCRS